MALKVRETELADSFSASFTECNERKRPILTDKTLLSHHSFKSVPGSHSFVGPVFFGPLLGLRVRRLVSEEMSSSTDNLLANYKGKLAKWKQGVKVLIGSLSKHDVDES